MEAFDRIKCGIPTVDEALDNIRAGDNVVFQVTQLADFAYFVDPYVRQAKEDGRDLVYIRFSDDEPLVAREDATWYELDPEEGFEPFTVTVHNIITAHGREAFYVFDCLSDLQTAWAADLMMGNFFRLTCPYLFILDTVAFFPVLRSMHSHEALARIKETTQLFLDVFSTETEIYLHPVKVWNRYSPSMFMPHRAERADGAFHTVSEAVNVSRYYALVELSSPGVDLNTDSWERYFQYCRLAPADEDETIRTTLCHMMMTGDRKMREMFMEHFTREDYLRVHERMIGSGRIGGKGAGMLMARKIVSKNLPDLTTRTEEHDSYYIGDHVFYTFLVHNGLWNLRIEQKTDEGYHAVAERMREGILGGSFPEDVRDMFRRMLEYYGQSPIIARSSSLLEDGFGNAFAGKYDSVFCVNQGSPEERLATFETAVKTVYASTMSASALEYREMRGLKEYDEQMSVLVQRVSGSMDGDLFYPSAAGVGYSYDPYNFDNRIDPTRGMLRLVSGLGTRAVDRTGSDYVRIVHLDRPQQTMFTAIDERVRYSQHHLDVLNLKTNKTETVSLATVMQTAPAWYRERVCEHDREGESRLRERGIFGNVLFGTCQGLVDDKHFIDDMESMLRVLHENYEFPVDIEFTVNLAADGSYVVCLLQCRPLQVLHDTGERLAPMPARDDMSVVFASKGTSMGMSQRRGVDAVALIDSAGYKALPYREKSRVAQAVRTVNDYFRNSGKTVVLMAPGRVGTSSPELGVPLAFSELSQFAAIIEYDDAEAGFLPELSFGSHLFQDLVESDIFYTALFSISQRSEFNRSLLLETGREMTGVLGNLPFASIVHVLDTAGTGLELDYDVMSGEVICGFPRS